jgi:hypothetical protein
MFYLTVDITTVGSNGRPRTVVRTLACSLTAAFRVADSHTPAPLNPAVRERIRRGHGGSAQVGQVHIAIGCAA